MRKLNTLVLLLGGFAQVAFGQATPPSLVNYQGVLRNAADAPQSGTFDMVFRLFSADVAGDEILVDSHLAAGTGGVVVSGGLFNTQVGGGAIADGAGAGVYASVAEAFRDYGSAYLEVQVGAEVLSPRIRVAAAPYALNADHLDGRSSAFFLDTSATPQEKTGLLTCNGGIDLGPGGSDDLTAADITSLTGGGNADPLHTHNNVGNANTLDALDSSQFLRSDTSDSYTSGTLTFADGTRLLVDDGSAAAPGIGFSPDPGTGLFYSPGPGTLGLAVSGSKVVEVYSTGDVVIGRRLYPGDQATEFLDWDSALGNFLLTDDLSLGGALRTGTTVPSPGAWNHLGAGGSPSSGAMNGAGDLFLENDLEVNGVAFLNGELRMDDNGPDGNQTIYFYNAASPTGESLAWNEASDRFELSDDLSLAGSLDLGAGANDDLTAADVTTLTGGGNADALHTHAEVGNSDTLDGLDSTAFARLGTANTFTTGAQTVQTGAAGNRGVVVRGAAAQTANLQEWQDSGSVVHASIGSGGSLTLNTGGSTDVSVTETGIDRNNGASDTTFTVQNSGTGKMTLQVDGVIRSGDPLFDATSYNYNRIALGVTAPVAEASMDLRNDLYVEGSIEGRDQLYTEGRLLAESIIVVADSTPDVGQAFSSFGTGTSTSGDMTASGDVFVTSDVEVGQSAYLSKNLYMEGDVAAGADGDQTIFFYDEDSRTTNFIRWDDSRADAACSGTGATNEAMVFNVPDGIGPSEAFLFMQGIDVEFKIDDLGSAALDGTLTQSGACDLAETFIGPEGLEPGTVVALVPGEREAVEAATRPYDPTAVGVVSTRPGVLLSGPTADAYPLWSELQAIRKQLAAMPRPPAHAMTEAPDGADDTVRDANPAAAGLVAEDPVTAVQRQALGARAGELEARLDSWTRGNVPVALVGRVPVKVDANHGPIRHGDYLTSSSTPGHAMVLDRPGPYFGIALEELAAGEGTILALLGDGWYGGTTGPARNEGAGSGAVAPGGSKAVVQETEGSLQILLDRDANDQARFSIFRDGKKSLASEVFRVDEDGNVFAKGSFRPASLDLAEYHPVTEPVEVADVVVVDRNNPGKLRKGDAASDSAVVGIVSAEPGVLMGSGLARIAAADPDLAVKLDEARVRGDRTEEASLWRDLETKFNLTHAAIALSGTVPCKVDAGYGPIRVGDLLTVSPTPGHAMRSTDHAAGTVLGKALEPLESGTGIIKALVMLR